jgi:predicted acylesterase/phospholipase RssA
MAETVLNYLALAPAIGPVSPDDRRRARAAGGPPRRPSPAAGDTASETSSHLPDPFDKLPEELQNSPEAQLLRPVGDHKVYNIVHLIYRARHYEGHSKDYDFSRASMQEHWRAGYYDTIRTLRHPEVIERPANHEGLFTFDLSQDGRE